MRNRPISILSAVVLAAAAILTLAGCNSAGDKGALVSLPTGAVPTTFGDIPTTPTIPSAPTSTEPTDPGSALFAKIIPVPPGATPNPNQPIGPLDLTGFIDAFWAPDARADATIFYRKAGFQVAALQGWMNSDGSQGEVFLVQFSANSGANKARDDLLVGWRDSKSSPGVPSDRQFPTASGNVTATELLVTKLDSGGDANVRLVAAYNNIMIYVRLWTAKVPDPQTAEDMLTRQLARLS